MNHEFKNKIKRRLYESLLKEANDDDNEYSPVIYPPPFWKPDPSRIWRGAQPGIPDDTLGRGWNDDYFYQIYLEQAWDEVQNTGSHEWPDWYLDFDPFYDPRTDPRWDPTRYRYNRPYLPPSLRPIGPGMKEPEEAGDEGNQPIYGFMPGRYNRPNIPDTSI